MVHPRTSLQVVVSAASREKPAPVVSFRGAASVVAKDGATPATRSAPVRFGGQVWDNSHRAVHSTASASVETPGTPSHPSMTCAPLQPCFGEAGGTVRDTDTFCSPSPASVRHGTQNREIETRFGLLFLPTPHQLVMSPPSGGHAELAHVRSTSSFHFGGFLDMIALAKAPTSSLR